jgi:hypothetical protein
MQPGRPLNDEAAAARSHERPTSLSAFPAPQWQDVHILDEDEQNAIIQELQDSHSFNRTLFRVRRPPPPSDLTATMPRSGPSQGRRACWRW